MEVVDRRQSRWGSLQIFFSLSGRIDSIHFRLWMKLLFQRPLGEEKWDSRGPLLPRAFPFPTQFGLFRWHQSGPIASSYLGKKTYKI